MALGKATVDITANLKPLQKGLLQARTAVTAMVKRAGSALKSGFTSAFRAVTSGLKSIIRLAKLAAVALLGIGVASLKIASDVTETKNLFGIAMGSMRDEAEEWVQEYSKARNLFDNNTRGMLSSLAIMLKSMGFTQKEAFDMSKSLVRAALDIKSAYNISLSRAFDKVKSGLVGQTEPLQSIGILTGELAMKNEALKIGLLKTNDAVKKTRFEGSRQINGQLKAIKATQKQASGFTDLQKVMLRHNAILFGARLAYDDFLNTLNDPSNVFEQIKQQLQRTGETIGKVFIDDVTKAGITIRDWFVKNQSTVDKWANVVKDGIGIVVAKLTEYLDLAKSGDFKTIFEDIGSIFGGLAKGLVDLFEKIKPVALDLGKQIGMGFWEAVKDTPIGDLIKKTGKAASIAGTAFDIGTAPIRAQVAIAARLAEPQIVPGYVQARTRRTPEEIDAFARSERERVKQSLEAGKFLGLSQAEVLAELRRINRNLTNNERPF